jgi:hypothetical protein
LANSFHVRGGLEGFSSRCKRYGNARYVVANPLWEIPKGNAKWDGPAGNTGTLFGDTSVTQPNPQCSNTTLVAPSLAAFCTLNSLAMKVPANTPGAVVLADGSSVVNVLVNPKPGEIGTLGSRTLDSFGTFFLDEVGLSVSGTTFGREPGT